MSKQLSKITHQRVIVTLVDGSAFSGLIAAHDSEVIRLVNVEAHTPNQSPRPVDGELFIERARVAYVQRP